MTKTWPCANVNISLAIFAVVGALIGTLVGSIANAKPISIRRVSDLDFGSAAQGDPARQILPGTSENSQNASFGVSGDKNRAYTIVLPTSSVPITTGVGGAGRTLSLTGFSSFPSGASGLLNNQGDQTLYVGATRSAISLTQVVGSYSGTFTVTVVY